MQASSCWFYMAPRFWMDGGDQSWGLGEGGGSVYIYNRQRTIFITSLRFQFSGVNTYGPPSPSSTT